MIIDGSSGGDYFMDFKVGVGQSDFAALRESGNYYVDKTELIYELIIFRH